MSDNLLKWEDELFEEVAYYVVRNNVPSTNLIMLAFNFSYKRTRAIFDILEQLGIISLPIPEKGREVLVDEAKLKEILENEK